MAIATAKKPKSDTYFAEYASNAGQSLKVDREKNVIYGVKLHGFASDNNRDYSPKALQGALHLYEGVKANVNHPPKENLGAWRNYQDRIGVIRNARFVAESGIFGDLHYNPKHALAEQLLFDAENSPESVGFSPVVKGKTSMQRNGRVLVEAISHVRSVDLVPDPATNRSLFEQTDIEEQDMLESLTVDELKAKRPDLAEAILAEQKDSADLAAKDSEIKTLREQLDAYEAEKTIRERRAAVDAKLAEAKLPEALMTEVFLESCYDANDSMLAKLIEDRKSLAGNFKPKPRSKDQTDLAESFAYPDRMDTKEFVAALRR